MKKNNKPYIIVLAILIIFFLIILLSNIFKKEEKELYLVVDQSSVFTYKDKKWSLVKKADYEKYNWKKVKYYEDGIELGENDLVYTNDKWYIFDSKKDAIIPSNLFLGVGGFENLKVLPNKKEELTDEDYLLINQILTENNCSHNNIATEEKITIDLDNDGKLENLYILSNVFSNTNPSPNYYNIIFYEENNKINYVYKEIIESANMYDSCKIYLQNIIDLDNDNKYELITGCGYYSNNGVINNIYTLKNKEYKLLISNQ